jgi:alcohol dehydrogenase/propanol-preferring alcohol dehydrogenase
VGDVKELRALIAIAKQGKIPAIPVELTPQKNADAVLNRLKNGKITGRVVLVGESA